MAKPLKMDESGDSEDLQALFDSIAGGVAVAPPPPPRASDASGDSDELQALFDSVVANVAAAEPDQQQAAAGDDAAVFNRLGHMARQLHDSLRELGYDKIIEDSARQIPDARQRLTYIAQMTEQAASRVLNATDIAKPLQDDLLARSEALAARWQRMFANQLSMDEFKQLATDSGAYFNEAPGKLKATNEQLIEIMMAQDFQDLTGQVIRKVVDLVQGLESQLLQVLVEALPVERRGEAGSGLLNGPVIDAAGRNDVVGSQSQVDELLESLGF